MKLMIIINIHLIIIKLLLLLQIFLIKILYLNRKKRKSLKKSPQKNEKNWEICQHLKTLNWLRYFAIFEAHPYFQIETRLSVPSCLLGIAEPENKELY